MGLFFTSARSRSFAWSSVVAAAVAFSAVATGQDTRPSGRDALDEALNKNNQARMGLNKLSTDERSALATFLKTKEELARDQTSLNQSARAYMKAKGYTPITVVGRRKLKLDEFGMEREYLIVSDDFGKYACSGITGLYPPGIYWGKDFLLGIAALVDSTGFEETLFSVRKIRTFQD